MSRGGLWFGRDDGLAAKDHRMRWDYERGGQHEKKKKGRHWTHAKPRLSVREAIPEYQDRQKLQAVVFIASGVPVFDGVVGWLAEMQLKRGRRPSLVSDDRPKQQAN